MLSYAGRNAGAINQLKTMYFDHPEWTPCGVGLLPATWMRHREGLEEVILAHPKVFPAYRKGQKKHFDEVHSPLYEEGCFTDAWGTVWENCHRGFDSYIADCPLPEWDAMRAWQPPSPDVNDLQGTGRNWEQLRQHLADRRKSIGRNIAKMASRKPTPTRYPDAWEQSARRLKAPPSRRTGEQVTPK